MEAETISVPTLLDYSRTFDRKKVVDSHIGIKRRFCKHDLNFMNSGVKKKTAFINSKTGFFETPAFKI